MMTVHEVSRLTGVSPRTLQYYDQIGLLVPVRTEAGYRLYDDAALERLQQILLFRELEFPLKEIKTILDDPHFDRGKALAQQIELLTLKKQRLERIIALACDIQQKGEYTMNFEAFDKTQIEEYAKQAKAQWGNTPEYAEYTEKNAPRSVSDEQKIAGDFMKIFAEFGAVRTLSPDAPAVRGLVKKLQDFITGHYYHCSTETLRGLGQMYAADSAFRENIDRAGGGGTAEFVSRAIALYSEISK